MGIVLVGGESGGGYMITVSLDFEDLKCNGAVVHLTGAMCARDCENVQFLSTCA